MPRRSRIHVPNFLDPRALSKFNEEHSQDEDRWITLGVDRAGSLLVICHTYREETAVSAWIQLISARKVIKNERSRVGRDPPYTANDQSGRPEDIFLQKPQNCRKLSHDSRHETDFSDRC